MKAFNRNLNRPKQKFTKEEDEILRKQVQIHGEKHWNSVASFLQGRTAKQCRERWKNYLSPEVSNSEWTQEEDLLLYNLIKKLGKKWSQLATYFKTRTDVMLKNRWALLNRQINKLQGKKHSVRNVSPPTAIPQQKNMKLQLPIQIPLINLDNLDIVTPHNKTTTDTNKEITTRITNQTINTKNDAFPQFIDSTNE